MGEAANAALTDALHAATEELKHTNRTLERTTLQLQRIANGSEDSNALVLNEAREVKLIAERVVLAEEKVVARLVAIETALGIMREATGAQKTHTEEAVAVGMLKAFGQLPPSARWSLVAMAPALAFLGWCVHELMAK